MFRTNVAAFERPVRFLMGVGMAAYAFFGFPEPSILFVALGICLALTGLIGFCPACAIAGRQPRSKPKKETQ